MLAALHARAVLPPPESESDEEDEGEAAGGAACAPAAGPGAGPSRLGTNQQQQGQQQQQGGGGAGGGNSRGGGGGSVYGHSMACGQRGPRHGGILLTELAGMYLSDTHDQVCVGVRLVVLEL